MLQIHKMCFYVIQVQKIEKQVKNTQSFTQLSFSVPGVSQFGKTSPWKFKMKEKSTLVLGIPKMFTSNPWIKVYTKWQLLPLKLQNWQKWSLGIQTWNFTKYPCTIHEYTIWNNLINLWGIYKVSPLKIQYYTNGPLSFKIIKLYNLGPCTNV